MLILKLITWLVFISLVGCSTTSEVKETDSEPVVEKTSVKEKVEVPTAISPKVMFLLMAAEIAGQRSQYDAALDGYLQAAKIVNDPKVAERATKIGLYVKDTEKTDEAVSLWLKQDSNNLSAKKIAVLSALRGSDKALAIKYMNTLLEDDPAGFEPTLMELMKVLEKEGNTQFVYDALEGVGEQHPNEAVVFFVQSLLASKQNKKEVAEKKVNKALVIQPDWDKALVLRAQYAIQGEHFNVAKEDLSKILQKTPKNVRVKKMLAQVLVKSEDFVEAEQMYQSIVKSKPEDGEAQFALALIYLQQGKEDEALVYLNKLINTPRWGAPASFYIGRVEYKREHFDQALVWFDKVTRGPYVFDASMAAVSVQLSKKNYTEAERRIEKIAEAYPNKWVSIVLLKAEIYNAQKKYQQAFSVLTEVLKGNPEQRDLLYTRALLAEKVGKLDVLEADLKRILVKHPDDANALNALGYTLADRTTRYEEAEAYLMQAIKLKPEEAVIIDSLGWLNFKQGKLDQALVYLRDAYQRQPESEIAAHLAEVLRALGNHREAKKIFNEAFSKSPDDEYLLKVRHLFE